MPMSTLEFCYRCLADFANFNLRSEFVTPMSTLEFWYRCMVDFANFKGTVSL